MQSIERYMRAICAAALSLVAWLDVREHSDEIFRSH